MGWRATLMMVVSITVLSVTMSMALRACFDRGWSLSVRRWANNTTCWYALMSLEATLSGGLSSMTSSMLLARVACTDISSTWTSIIATCWIILRCLGRIPRCLLASRSTGLWYHIDLTSIWLTLMRLSILSWIACRLLLLDALALAWEGKMLLRLTFCRSRVLWATILAIAATGWLYIWLRRLRLLLLIWITAGRLDRLIALPVCADNIVIGLMALRLLNQFDDLLSIVQLRVVADRLSYNNLLLIMCVERLSLVSTVVIFKVID